MSVAGYPVEIRPPDIGRWRAGNRGIDHVTTFDSGRAGPHVMIAALIHGNELCGAVALDFLLRHRLRPRRGRLTLCFANTAAYAAFDRDRPTASRFVDEDMNRVWAAEALDGDRDSQELRRARALRPVVDEVDILLDIHSMQHDSPALSLAGPLEKGRLLAAGVGVPAHVVSDGGHAAGTRLRDYGAFSDPASPRVALLVECGQHWKRTTATTAIEVCLRFLLHLGLVERAFAEPHLPVGPQPPQRFIEVTEAVTVDDEPFVFAADYRGLEVIPRAGTLIGRAGEREVRTPYDDCVLVMPSRRRGKGLTAVRLGRLVP